MGMVRRVSRFQLWVPLVISLASICAAVFNSIDNIVIDCGSEQSTIVDQRTFLADNQVSWTLSAPNSILATTSLNSVSSDYFAVLHRTARIFPSPSSYTFPIKTRGRHFIRFHFYPFLFQGYDLTTASFSISAQGISLRRDFRPQVVRPDMLREYSMNITTSPLVISFTPSVNSFAFVNGIEVVSVPDGLLFNTASTVNLNGYYENLPATVLETIHRVNMGGPLVTPFNDTLGRTWVTDDISLTNERAAKAVSFSGKLNFLPAGATEETAPTFVYNTAREPTISMVLNQILNITWEFDVDLGFNYLVRMHFCDIVSSDFNQLYFNIYIGGMTAAANFDLSTRTTKHLAAPYYSDFVVYVGDGGTRKLSISICPSNVPTTLIRKAILNGLEVMKMNNSLGNLDDPTIPFTSSQRDRKINLGIVLGPAMVMALLAILLLVLLSRRIFFNSNARQPYPGITKYSFSKLRKATENFSNHNKIGKGGFGTVYKGILDNNEVAVKRASQIQENQELKQFHTELLLMSQLLHVNLVSLCGFCDERGEKILVYEYMQNGNLQQHLYRSGGQLNRQILSWEQRLTICVGAATGLHYIHNSKEQPIIHRDIKTTNILLDEKLVAKIADFGVSKENTPPVDVSSGGQISTVVGSDGYIDPEFQVTRKMTDKSDVYSFGVVLWEILCAIPVLGNRNLPVPQGQSHQESEVNYIVEWALMWYNKKELDVIVDPKIKGTIMPDSLSVFAEIAAMCVRYKGVDRPSMGKVLSNLEKALRLQQGKTQENALQIMAEQPWRDQDISSSEPLNPAEPENTSTTRSGLLSSVNYEFSMLTGAKGR